MFVVHTCFFCHVTRKQLVANNGLLTRSTISCFFSGKQVIDLLTNDNLTSYSA